MTIEEPLGRRERKKAATRQAIADAALELFLARGFDAVSIKDIADEADVSTTTIFKHFPSKEALLFDREDDFARQLAAAVRERPEGVGLLDAIRRHALAAWVPVALDPQLDELTALVDQTPALRNYWEGLWSRHARALTAVVAEDLGRPADDLASATLSRFVVQIPILVKGREDARQAVSEVFEILARGWDV
ncbi:AcrR family transcriptional regulator [Rhodococcus sp. 27YEA15]|uniref:TetR/AcrR family transcriptional regulator n=1 Tax=Rhodococcus sp. 27YEA15 TaxID=3156259 RepID=UPI003C7E376C